MRLTPALTRNGIAFSLLIFGIVLWGFWNTYFANPLQLPNFWLHIHGACMTLWCLMLISQAYLVKAKRLDLHRAIGKLSYVLAPLNFVLMLAVVRIRFPTFTDLFDQGMLTPEGHFFIAASFVDAGLYGLFFALAIVNKGSAAVHARYMLCTPLPVIGAATDRIIGAFFPGLVTFWTETLGAIHIETFTWAVLDVGLLALAAWDWKSRQRVNVFGRVAAIFLPLQIIAMNWYRLPLLPAFGEWSFGA